MKKGDYVEVLLGADKGKIAEVWTVDGIRVLTHIKGQEVLDQYRDRDLRILSAQEAAVYIRESTDPEKTD